jgi:hypothetical protein
VGKLKIALHQWPCETSISGLCWRPKEITN